MPNFNILACVKSQLQHLTVCIVVNGEKICLVLDPELPVTRSNPCQTCPSYFTFKTHRCTDRWTGLFFQTLYHLAHVKLLRSVKMLPRKQKKMFMLIRSKLKGAKILAVRDLIHKGMDGSCLREGQETSVYLLHVTRIVSNSMVTGKKNEL